MRPHLSRRVNLTLGKVFFFTVGTAIGRTQSYTKVKSYKTEFAKKETGCMEDTLPTMISLLIRAATDAV